MSDLIADCTQNAQGIWIPDGMIIADQHAVSYFHAYIGNAQSIDINAPTNAGFEQCDCLMAVPAPIAECCE